MQIFQEIEKLYPKYLDFLEDICNIESPTSLKEGVDKVCEYCIAFAKEKGFKAEVFLQDISGNAALITMNEKAEGQPIVLSAHMDTVHPVGSFGYPAVRRDEEFMYGPGVMDCKGGIAAAFLAMEALSVSGFDKRPIKLFLQSDEENSSKTSKKETIRTMCESSKGALCFLNLEGHVKGTAVLTRKGIIRYKFIIRGKAIHSARCAYGANAIAEAAHKIIELEKMKDVEGITCNCGVINGGTAANTVAEHCEFFADIRFSTPEQLSNAKETVKRLAEKSFVEGCVTEIEEVSYRPAMPESEENTELLKKMNEIYEKCGLPTLDARFCVSGSDAAYITECKIPCVDSLGTEGGNIHSTREYARMLSLCESAKRVASVIFLMH